MRSTWICGLHIKAAAGSLRLELGVKFDTLAAVELAIRAHGNSLGSPIGEETLGRSKPLANE